jgi:hypothetical protein
LTTSVNEKDTDDESLCGHSNRIYEAAPQLQSVREASASVSGIERPGIDDSVGLAIGLGLLKQRKKLTTHCLKSVIHYMRVANDRFHLTSPYSLSGIINNVVPLSSRLNFRRVFACTNCYHQCNEKKCIDCSIKEQDHAVSRFVILDILPQIELLLSRNGFTRILRNPNSPDLGRK